MFLLQCKYFVRLVPATLSVCFVEHPVYTMPGLNTSRKPIYKFVRETEEHDVATVACRKCNFVR